MSEEEKIEAGVEEIKEDLRPEMTIPELEMSIRDHIAQLSLSKKIYGNTVINSLFATYVFFVSQFTENKDLVQIIMDHAHHVCNALEAKIAEMEKQTSVEEK